MTPPSSLHRVRHAPSARIVPRLSARWAWGWALVLGTLAVTSALASGSLHAAEIQPERDPTAAPAAARAPAPASAPASSETSDGLDAISAALAQRLVINGKPFLVDRGWLRGVGDFIGEARIERIEPTAVWLREAGVLRKLPLYPQVQVRMESAGLNTASNAGTKTPRSAVGAHRAAANAPSSHPPGDPALEESP